MAVSGKLLFDLDHDASWNMAADQYLLDLADRTGSATLRFYGWSTPSLSLGYFQSAAERIRHGPSSALPLVRRATGGGAIVHDRELTYSIVVPASRAARGEHLPLYQQVHRAIVKSFSDFCLHLQRYGDVSSSPSRVSEKGQDRWLCFQRRTAEDLVLSGYKLVGSAQRRGRQSIIQHGSILLGACSYAPELPGVLELSGKTIGGSEIAKRVIHHLKEAQWAFSGARVWDEGAVEAVDQINRERFATAAWNRRR